MQIAAIIQKGVETGDHIIIVSKAEAKDLYDTQVEYCAQNPKKRKAKTVLKQFEDNFCIW
jgi:hypothetical protein